MDHSTAHYSFYYNTMDFRKTNAVILLAIVILIIVVMFA